MTVWNNPKPASKDEADREAIKDLATMLAREAFARATVMRESPTEQAALAGRGASVAFYFLSGTVAKVDAQFGGPHTIPTGTALNHLTLAGDSVADALNLNRDAFTRFDRWAISLALRLVRGVVARLYVRDRIRGTK